MYKVVYSIHFSIIKAIEELETKVNKLEKEGWIPLGGVCYGKNDTLFQAMVKKQE